MNASEMRWLLQTIDDPATAERFVMAQYERARISYQVMADIAREYGWINRRASEAMIAATRYSKLATCANSTEYATAQC